jgi:adenine-specific DNA methylase/predicted RNA binding protein YcfA (HicA-like mRNA interferase family)
MIAKQAEPQWRPEQDMQKNPRWFSPPIYGMTTFGDIFSLRQLVVLNTFIMLFQDIHNKILNDANTTCLVTSQAYADAIVMYLALAIDKCADYWSSICSWHTSAEKMTHVFGHQAIPMVWDFAEANPFSSSSGNFMGAIGWIAKVIETTSCNTSASLEHQFVDSSVLFVHTISRIGKEGGMARMPRKIRQLRAVGAYIATQEGSHQKWKHPKITAMVELAGNDGKDAKYYQEQQVKQLIRKIREAQ